MGQNIGDESQTLNSKKEVIELGMLETDNVPHEADFSTEEYVTAVALQEFGYLGSIDLLMMQ